MRATVEQKQQDFTSGWLFKKTRTYFNVVVRIELSDSERSALNERKLWDYVLYEIPNPNYESDLEFSRGDATPPQRTISKTIRDFCDPRFSTRSFDTPGEAKNWASELTTHLKSLKEIIEHNTRLGTTQTYDL